MDLLQSIKNVFSSQLTNQIANALGVDGTAATQAVDKAVPAMIAGLVRQGSTPSGAVQLFNAVDKVDPSILNNLGTAFSGGNLQSWIETGTKYLPMIFGQNYSSLFGTLGRLTGLGTGKIGPLLGMISPIVMAILSKAKSAGQMDVTSFGQMLADQRNRLPSLDPQLADTLGLGAVVAPAKQAAEAFGQTAQKSRDFAASTAGSAGPSIGRWLIPILALAAVALVLYVYVFTPDRGEVVHPLIGSQTQATVNPPGAGAPPRSQRPAVEEPESESTDNKPESESKEDASATDVIQPLTNFVTDASALFTEIKDEAGAKVAAEKLTGLAEKVGDLNLEKLTGPAKVIAAREVNKLRDKFKAWAEKSYSVPGVQSVLEPAVNSVVEKLKSAIE